MNCEKCNDLLSDFLDGAMSGEEQATFSRHLEDCLECFNVHAEINSIVSFCRENRGEYLAPPNEQALWLRIQNTIESESFISAAAQSSGRAAQRESWWSRIMGRSWELSFPQVAMAVVAIIVVASLATVFGLRGLQRVETNIASTNLSSRGGQTIALSGNPKAPELGGRLWQQQQQIKYWSQVVEERKAHWNPQVRADFEHNLNLLDETVQESMKKLSEQPQVHDEVTEEMLNSALNDKMQLLKEFSDL
jgi:hypothetical protein